MSDDHGRRIVRIEVERDVASDVESDVRAVSGLIDALVAAAYELARERDLPLADATAIVQDALRVELQKASVDRGYRIWMNDERTVLFRVFRDGLAEIARRDTPAHTWGPPIRMMEAR